MSGNSSVGNRTFYEAGDQRNPSREERDTATRFAEGKPHAHQPNDSKDQRTIANRLAAEEQHGDKTQENPEAAAYKKDPTLPAKLHGNEPSKGARIDAELQAEEEEIIKQKGQNLTGKKM